MQTTHPDWAPSLRLGHEEVKAPCAKRYARQANRAVEESGGCSVDNVITDGTPSVQEFNMFLPVTEESRTATADNEAHAGQREDCDTCKSKQLLVNGLLEENRRLRSELNKGELNEHFLHDDSRVKYYTGLPSLQLLLSLLTSVSSFLPERKKLSHFQMMLLTLMHLKLNLPNLHLAHLFNISSKAASSAFSDTVTTLHTRLTALVNWPDREYLQGSMSHQFTEAIGNCIAVILDCFEVSIESPSNLTAQAQMYSHNNHSRKYLMGIVPQGTVCFISKSWGGRESDKLLTESSGLLQKLLPGDVVLADHGFNIKDGVGFMFAEVKISASGRCQLEARD